MQWIGLPDARTPGKRTTGSWPSLATLAVALGLELVVDGTHPDPRRVTSRRSTPSAGSA
ncbi:hypothetical protein QJS66_09010 [Kocuria rhizophila]|nr:hypothetical protein QJS66_09010 [Kocuria rhizophila]